MRKSDHQLVQRVLDGDMGREEFDRFQQRLRDEPELVDLYGGYAFLHHMLDEEAEGGGFQECAVDEVRSNLPLWIAGLVAVVALAAIGIVRPWSRGGFKDVAVAGFSADALWSIEGTNIRVGSSHKLAAGNTIHLERGRAETILSPLFTAIVDGPATMRVETGDRVRLLAGRGYFTRRNTGRFVVSTPAFTAVSEGTAFGVIAGGENGDEIHVENGKVRVTSVSTGEAAELSAGQAMQVAAAGTMHRIQPDSGAFAKRLGRFEAVLSDPFAAQDWGTDHGVPTISPHRISGTNYAVRADLPETVPSDGKPVLLAALEVGKSAGDGFHTDGWAGLSFFRGEEELLFFGDSFGARVSWSLDVKQRIPVIFPEEDVVGPMRVTLRYDRRSGEVSLHEGGIPLRPAFCQGTLEPGLGFDSVRLGASSGANLTVTGLEIRAGGGH